MRFLRIFLVLTICGAIPAAALAADKQLLSPDDPPPPGSVRPSETISTRSENITSATRDIIDAGQPVRFREYAAVKTLVPVEPLKVTETEKEVHIQIPGDVLFDFNRWGIRSDAAATLAVVAEILGRHPNAKIVLEGHTDAKGSEEYNQDLSLKRALSVKAWLIHRGGLNPLRILTEGLGKQKPVAPNEQPDGSDNPEGRQQNRRVEIILQKDHG